MPFCTGGAVAPRPLPVQTKFPSCQGRARERYKENGGVRLVYNDLASTRPAESARDHPSAVAQRRVPAALRRRQLERAHACARADRARPRRDSGGPRRAPGAAATQAEDVLGVPTVRVGYTAPRIPFVQNYARFERFWPRLAGLLAELLAQRGRQSLIHAQHVRTGAGRRAGRPARGRAGGRHRARPLAVGLFQHRAARQPPAQAKAGLRWQPTCPPGWGRCAARWRCRPSHTSCAPAPPPSRAAPGQRGDRRQQLWPRGCARSCRPSACMSSPVWSIWPRSRPRWPRRSRACRRASRFCCSWASSGTARARIC